MGMWLCVYAASGITGLFVGRCVARRRVEEPVRRYRYTVPPTVPSDN
jgi:hypothetical protein